MFRVTPSPTYLGSRCAVMRVNISSRNKTGSDLWDQPEVVLFEPPPLFLRMADLVPSFAEIGAIESNNVRSTFSSHLVLLDRAILIDLNVPTIQRAWPERDLQVAPEIRGLPDSPLNGRIRGVTVYHRAIACSVETVPVLANRLKNTE